MLQCTVGWTSSQTQPGDMANLKLQYLKDLKERITDLMKNNMSLIQQKENCLQHWDEVERYRQLREEQITETQNHQPLTSLGSYASFKICSDLIAMKEISPKTHIIYERQGYDTILNSAFRNMRIDLALSQAKPVPPIQNGESYDDLVQQIPYQMNVHPSHTFSGLASQLAPLSSDEITDARKLWMTGWLKAQADYVAIRQSEDARIAKMNPADRLLMEGFPGWQSSQNQERERFLRDALSQLRSSFHDQYVQQLGLLPVGFMTHPLDLTKQSDRDELIEIFANANKINSENLNKIEQTPETFPDLLPLMSYSVVANSRAMKYSPTKQESDVVTQAVASDYFWYTIGNYAKILIEIGVATGAAYRTAKWVIEYMDWNALAAKLFEHLGLEKGQAVSKLSLIGSTYLVGESFNLVFIYQARENYDQIWAEFFSSADGQQVLRASTDLDSARMNEYFSIAMVWVGTGIVPTAQTFMRFIKLNPAERNIVRRMINYMLTHQAPAAPANP